MGRNDAALITDRGGMYHPGLLGILTNACAINKREGEAEFNVERSCYSFHLAGGLRLVL